MAIYRHLDELGTTTPAAIGGALGLPAIEAAALLSRKRLRDGEGLGGTERDTAKRGATSAVVREATPREPDYRARLWAHPRAMLRKRCKFAPSFIGGRSQAL